MKPAKKKVKKNAAGALERFCGAGSDEKNVQSYRPKMANTDFAALTKEEPELVEELEECDGAGAEELLEEDDSLLHGDSSSKNGRNTLNTAIKKAKSSKILKTNCRTAIVHGKHTVFIFEQGFFYPAFDSCPA